MTWRGKSAFTRELEKRGIRQIVSRPRHPQTLGKVAQSFSEAAIAGPLRAVYEAVLCNGCNGRWS